jgi:glycosyltransferase involved in cell wall biosynthesis
MTRKKYCVFLGNNTFPHGWAEVQKVLLISKCLLVTGNEITVICPNGTHSSKDRPGMPATGIYEGVKYVYTSGSPYRNSSFIARNMTKVKGRINEFLLLWKMRREKQLDFILLSTHSFSEVLYSAILGKLFGCKTILNYVEFHSRIPKSNFWARLNDKLHDKYSARLSDAIFPISEFIIEHFTKISPTKKYLKIPGLTNYERFENTPVLQGEKYFMYCGAASYKEVVLFIIDAYNKVNTTNTLLYLVVNGTEADKNVIKDYAANTAKKDNIKFFSKLTDEELNTLYLNAVALLIPLRNTFQDIARFPHKTGEYLASGNPVIATNVGELKYYFTDKKDMLLAEDYDIDLYADKMQYINENPDAAKRIGADGKERGRQLFSFRVKAKEINDFMDEMQKK